MASWVNCMEGSPRTALLSSLTRLSNINQSTTHYHTGQASGFIHTFYTFISSRFSKVILLQERSPYQPLVPHLLNKHNILYTVSWKWIVIITKRPVGIKSRPRLLMVYDQQIKSRSWYLRKCWDYRKQCQMLVKLNISPGCWCLIATSIKQTEFPITNVV